MFDEKTVDALMARIPAGHRKRWCDGYEGGYLCACMGCVNRHLGSKLPYLLFTKEVWLAWMARQPKEDKDD